MTHFQPRLRTPIPAGAGESSAEAPAPGRKTTPCFFSKREGSPGLYVPQNEKICSFLHIFLHEVSRRTKKSRCNATLNSKSQEGRRPQRALTSSLKLTVISDTCFTHSLLVFKIKINKKSPEAHKIPGRREGTSVFQEKQKNTV